MSRFNSTFSRKSGRDQSVTAQINMAPMIDFLVITIAYFLISASFCSVGLIDSSFQEAQGGSGGGNAMEKREVEITLKADHSLAVKRGTVSTTMTSENLIEMLKGDAGSAPEMVSLNAEAGINFDEVIRLFNKVRQTVPQVTLNVDSL